MSAPYEVKCDECKRTMRITDDDRVALAGGTCESCRASIAAKIAATVKRVDIFGVVHDTYQTEKELNGWKPTQGRMI